MVKKGHTSKISLKPVKIHEPKCPCRTRQSRPQCDLRLLINKRKQLHTTKIQTCNKEFIGVKKKVGFQFQRRVKMSRQEVCITVFENTSGEVKKGITVSRSISSEVKQISYTCSDNPPVGNGSTNNTNREGAQNINLNTPINSNSFENNKDTIQNTQMCERQSTFHETASKPIQKDLSNEKNASEKESSSSDEDDEEATGKRLRKKHPNRRLTLEKFTETPSFGCEQSLQKCLSQRPNFDPHKRTKTDEKIENNMLSSTNTVKPPTSAATGTNLWQQVLRNSERWKREECWCQGRIEYEAAATTGNEESGDQFLDLLKETTAALTRLRESSCPSLHDPDFFIPPAHAQLLQWKLTDDLSPVQCVQRVCEVRRWPAPEYQVTSHAAGWTASLQLHGQGFFSAKPAVTAELAQQVAAQELLQWLKLRPRPSPHPSLFTDPASNTRCLAGPRAATE